MRVQIGHGHYDCPADKQKRQPLLKCTHAVLLFRHDDRNCADDKSDKQRAYRVDMLLKQSIQGHYCHRHTDHPADGQPDQVAEAFLAFLLRSEYKPVDRTDEFIVKAKDKGDRAAGNTGHAVRHRHEKTVNCVSDHQSFPPDPVLSEPSLFFHSHNVFF